MTDTQNNSNSNAQEGKFLEGVVVKRAMKDTATVQVERYVKHPKYKKFQRRSKKFLVHDPGNTAEIGDKVKIRETRPISKRKRFVIVKV
ncbi:30S ribosomal protein S17 [Candidatus Kaiserbacteria bacterium RIFCSPHIGHO2_12_FULL_53_13]|uniref:Small ribosomal subunit protein uS17 n=1 Tax=Candidatus Kaiserbacteria bacterium RIFCSPHIGHO2_12_FULL_53_13 TaxID=1798502 RepID=A0A1F6E6P3_9BACT|nr:MAG: 30S ribosomal protein S17 [Candidatus Kaiserbacteria bacterium RIFCSPHIGHO2_12_FULL_53_13]OGG74643.1 MAG: 30S ribosomal protein S17 [Candidatus Kaiserbacteria bacterium RIFCSPLOWO2_01_FULL_52_36]